jgi:hypothetical protein
VTLIQPHPSQLPLEGGERREPSQERKPRAATAGEERKKRGTGRRRKERKGGRKPRTEHPDLSHHSAILSYSAIGSHLTCSLSPPPSYLPTFLLACHFPFRLSNLSPTFNSGFWVLCIAQGKGITRSLTILWSDFEV